VKIIKERERVCTQRILILVEPLDFAPPSLWDVEMHVTLKSWASVMLFPVSSIERFSDLAASPSYTQDEEKGNKFVLYGIGRSHLIYPKV
jgi:hypothetical protein